MTQPLLKNEHNGTRLKWFALVSHYNKMHSEIYQAISGHSVEPLYLSTALESLLPRSPLVILLNEYDELVTQLPGQHTLYFAAPYEVPVDTCIAQLRNRMYLHLSGGRKGVFHYYLPTVASYFFSRADHSDTAQWLGCFSGVYFYCQTKTDLPGWMTVEGEVSQPDSDFWVLTPSQEEALNAKYTEQKQQIISKEYQNV